MACNCAEMFMKTNETFSESAEMNTLLAVLSGNIIFIYFYLCKFAYSFFLPAVRWYGTQ